MMLSGSKHMQSESRCLRPVPHDTSHIAIVILVMPDHCAHPVQMLGNTVPILLISCHADQGQGIDVRATALLHGGRC